MYMPRHASTMGSLPNVHATACFNHEQFNYSTYMPWHASTMSSLLNVHATACFKHDEQFTRKSTQDSKGACL